MAEPENDTPNQTARLVFLLSLKKTEKRIGLPPGTLERIADLEDWGFIVQINALIETAVTQLLVRWFVTEVHAPNQAALVNAFSKLPPRTKLDLAKALGLAKRIVKAATYVGDTRNSVAHNIARAAKFSLAAHFANEDLKTLPAKLGLEDAAWLPHAEVLELLRTHPRDALLLAAANALNELEELHRHRRVAQEMMKAGQQPISLDEFRAETKKAVSQLLKSRAVSGDKEAPKA